MEKETLKKQLTEEGFLHVYEWKDEPGTEYPAHAHQDKVAMYVLEGGIVFHFDDGEVVLSAGDRFDVPVGKTHTAKVGDVGATFLVGEMIEGDS